MILFYFIFIFDNEEVYDCGHMTYHMMWGYKPKLDENGLEELKRMISGHIYIAWYPYGRHEDEA